MRKTSNTKALIDIKRLRTLKQTAAARVLKEEEERRKAFELEQQNRANSILSDIQQKAEKAASDNHNFYNVMRIEASDCENYCYRDDVNKLIGVAKIVADKLKDNKVDVYVCGGSLRFDFLTETSKK